MAYLKVSRPVVANPRATTFTQHNDLTKPPVTHCLIYSGSFSLFLDRFEAELLRDDLNRVLNSELMGGTASTGL